MAYKSKAGWYVKSVGYNECGSFESFQEARHHAKKHSRYNAECLIWYGTPKLVNASKEVYSRKVGGVYFKRVVPIIA